LLSTINCASKCICAGVKWLYPGAIAACVLLSLTGLELLLLACHRSGFWWNAGLAWEVKAWTAGLVAILWMTFGWAIFWASDVTGRIGSFIVTRRARFLFGLFLTVVIAVLVDSYLTCWLYFWRLGEFPDRETFRFGAANAIMLGEHLWEQEPRFTLLLTALLAGVGLVSGIVASRALSRWQREATGAVPRSCVALLVAANAVWLTNDYATHTGETSRLPRNRIEAWQHPWPPFSRELHSHVHPVLSLLTRPSGNGDGHEFAEIPTHELMPRAQGDLLDLAMPGATDRHSIVFVVIESLRSDAVLLSRDRKRVMPHVSDLARDGHLFSNCYVQSSHSDYSDPSILSSLFPLRTERLHFHSRRDPWPKVLAYDVFKKLGYATAMFSSQNEAWSNMHVFYESPSLDVLHDSRAYDGETYVEAGYFGTWMSDTGFLAGKLDDAITANLAIDWMRRQHRLNQPFFVSLNFQSTHFPYRVPEGCAEPFQPTRRPGDVSFLGASPEDVTGMRNAYYNSLHYIDSQIGRLLAFLDSTGLRDHTIIVVTGDHGEAFHEKLPLGQAEAGRSRSGHARKPYNEVTRVGCVLSGPNIVSNTRDDYLMQSIDIVPTIFGCLGLTNLPFFQGEDMLRRNRPPVEERLAFIHCRNPSVACDAVISGTGWKYLYDHRTERGELYWLPSDRNEVHDLASTEPDVAAAMNAALMEWRRRQLSYYGQPHYYDWFYPPRAPEIRDGSLALLKKRAREAEQRRVNSQTSDNSERHDSAKPPGEG
jgi:arylsulfatase A-like enzyme